VLTPGIAGEVVNIGNDHEISINDLAALVKRVSASSSPVVHMSYDAAYGPGFEDMLRRVPCIDKLHRLTGCRPETSLETMVRVLVEYERTKLSPMGLPQPAEAAFATSASDIQG
jgi:UDP-glucose 4-epimerase